MTTNEPSVTTALSKPRPIDTGVPLDEQFDVFGDALVRIVGGVAEQLHAVVVGAVEPVARDSASVIQRRQRICSH